MRTQCRPESPVRREVLATSLATEGAPESSRHRRRGCGHARLCGEPAQSWNSVPPLSVLLGVMGVFRPPRAPRPAPARPRPAHADASQEGCPGCTNYPGRRGFKPTNPRHSNRVRAGGFLPSSHSGCKPCSSGGHPSAASAQAQTAQPRAKVPRPEP